jgi:hypothetical protein
MTALATSVSAAALGGVAPAMVPPKAGPRLDVGNRTAVSLGPLSVPLIGEGRMVGRLALQLSVAVAPGEEPKISDRLPVIREAVMLALHDEARLAVEPGRPVDAAALAGVAGAAASAAAGVPADILLLDVAVD